MALSSNLFVMHCPVCDRAILASSTKCQFCGAQVTPMALTSDLEPTVTPVEDVARRATWQEISYVVIAYLWIAAGAVSALVGLLMGPFGILAVLFGAVQAWMGIGLLRQNWLAQTIAKFGSGLYAIYSGYFLIAGPFIQATGMPFPYSVYVASFALNLFQTYIIWYMGDD